MAAEQIQANRSKDHKINKHEEYLFHVEVTKKTHIASEERYEEVKKIIKSQPEMWLQAKDNIAKMYNGVNILHDPTVLPKREFVNGGAASLEQLKLQAAKDEAELAKIKLDEAKAKKTSK